VRIHALLGDSNSDFKIVFHESLNVKETFEDGSTFYYYARDGDSLTASFEVLADYDSDSDENVNAEPDV